jgi:hypothetical protein
LKEAPVQTKEETKKSRLAHLYEPILLFRPLDHHHRGLIVFFYRIRAMDLMQSFDAILFPSDGRPPHVVSLMTSPASFANPHTPAQTNAARVPHPEVLMEYIAEDPNMRAWHYLVRATAAPPHGVLKTKIKLSRLSRRST